MSEAFMILGTGSSHLDEKPPILMNEMVVPAQPDPANPDQMEAVDAVFSHDQDKLAALGLVGFWQGAMLLGEMAHEYQKRKAEEERAEQHAGDLHLDGPPDEN